MVKIRAGNRPRCQPHYLGQLLRPRFRMQPSKIAFQVRDFHDYARFLPWRVPLLGNRDILRCHRPHSLVGFAMDSPLEGDGFEPSVPARKSWFLLRKANCGTERGQPKRGVFMRYRWFESISL